MKVLPKINIFWLLLASIDKGRNLDKQMLIEGFMASIVLFIQWWEGRWYSILSSTNTKSGYLNSAFTGQAKGPERRGCLEAFN
jgi:hypothetical protein